MSLHHGRQARLSSLELVWKWLRAVAPLSSMMLGSLSRSSTRTVRATTVLFCFPTVAQATTHHHSSCLIFFFQLKGGKGPKASIHPSRTLSAELARTLSWELARKNQYHTVRAYSTSTSTRALRELSTTLFLPRRMGIHTCLLYTSPSPRDLSTSRMPSSA